MRARPGMSARPLRAGHGSAAGRPLRRAGGRAPESGGPGGDSGRSRRHRCGTLALKRAGEPGAGHPPEVSGLCGVGTVPTGTHGAAPPRRAVPEAGGRGMVRPRDGSPSPDPRAQLGSGAPGSVE